MINKLFCDSIKSMNIQTYFTKKENNTGDSDFIIYSFYFMENDLYVDNQATKKNYNIQVDLFTKDIITFADKIRTLETLLKNNNFMFQSSQVTYDQDTQFWRYMSDFFYIENIIN